MFSNRGDVSLNDLHLISQSWRVYESHHSLSQIQSDTEVFTRATPALNPWALEDFHAFRNRASLHILER